jgi:hypothetical protein
MSLLEPFRDDTMSTRSYILLQCEMRLFRSLFKPDSAFISLPQNQTTLPLASAQLSPLNCASSSSPMPSLTDSEKADLEAVYRRCRVQRNAFVIFQRLLRSDILAKSFSDDIIRRMRDVSNPILLKHTFCCYYYWYPGSKGYQTDACTTDLNELNRRAIVELVYEMAAALDVVVSIPLSAHDRESLYDRTSNIETGNANVFFGGSGNAKAFPGGNTNVVLGGGGNANVVLGGGGNANVVLGGGGNANVVLGGGGNANVVLGGGGGVQTRTVGETIQKEKYNEFVSHECTIFVPTFVASLKEEITHHEREQLLQNRDLRLPSYERYVALTFSPQTQDVKVLRETVESELRAEWAAHEVRRQKVMERLRATYSCWPLGSPAAHFMEDLCPDTWNAHIKLTIGVATSTEHCSKDFKSADAIGSSPKEVSTSREETEVPLKKDISLLKEDISLLKEDISLLKEDISLLKADVSLPKADVSLPKADVSLPKADVSLPKADVSLPKADVSLPKADVSLPKADVSLPKADVSLPKADVSLQKADVSLPKEDASLLKEDVSYLLDGLTKSPLPLLALAHHLYCKRSGWVDEVPR